MAKKKRGTVEQLKRKKAASMVGGDQLARSLRLNTQTRRTINAPMSPTSPRTHFVNAHGKHLPFENFLRSSSHDGKPMSSTSRFCGRFRKFVLNFGRGDGEYFENQYKIPPPEVHIGLIGHITRSAENVIVAFTLWNYRTSFSVTVLAFLIIYFVLVYFFAMLLYVVAQYHDGQEERYCVSSWIQDSDRDDKFELIFALSWTTMSTVGYGLVSPSNERGCYAVRVICAMEAFIGVLYVGYCGAVFFAKISRVSEQAQVTFSSCVCLQYGAGINEANIDVKREHSIPTGHSVRLEEINEEPFHDEGIEAHESQEDDENDPEQQQQDDQENGGFEGKIFESFRTPTKIDGLSECPVLEFRILNDNANGIGREFLQCQIEAVVSFSETRRDLPELLRKMPKHEMRGEPLVRSRFRRILVEPESHPYFQKVWYFRHTLDQSSPLLQRSVRREVAQLDGKWPTHRCSSPEDIRLAFRENILAINITFTGVSNLTADSAFATKKYKMQDIFFGWQFAPVAFYKSDEDESRAVSVDHSLVHDIRPQFGGGEEPLGIRAGLNSVHE